MSKWATSKKLCGENYLRGHAVSSEQGKVISRLSVCRTHFLGGHVEQCDSCGYLRNAHNSCRNRHCPKCQGMAKEKWVEARKAELLPCGYFHEVFTLPHILNPLILCNRKILPDLLFETVSTVLAEFASDPRWRLNGQTGFIAVLHTWSQTILDHFHLHCRKLSTFQYAVFVSHILPPKKVSNEKHFESSQHRPRRCVVI